MVRKNTSQPAKSQGTKHLASEAKSVTEIPKEPSKSYNQSSLRRSSRLAQIDKKQEVIVTPGSVADSAKKTSVGSFGRSRARSSTITGAKPTRESIRKAVINPSRTTDAKAAAKAGVQAATKTTSSPATKQSLKPVEELFGSTRSRTLVLRREQDQKPEQTQERAASSTSTSTSSPSSHHPLRVGNKILPSVEANHQPSNSSEIISRAGSESELSGSDDSNEYNLKQTGLAFPINERQFSFIRFILRNSDMFARVVSNRADIIDQLRRGRNINLEPSNPSDTYDFRNLKSTLKDETKNHPEYSTFNANIWDFDKLKCDASNEAVFQRTLMMSVIDRYRFFSTPLGGFNHVFDFSVERPWICPPMPSRDATGEDPILLTNPRPDLCVSFREAAVLSVECRRGLSGAMLKMINVEGSGHPTQQKAFPFLTLEAKNGEMNHASAPLLHQCLNAASQALHNMYEFFREASMEETFFKKVRFFTIAATASGCIFRMHRAVKISDGQIVPGYPLSFEYDVVQSLKDSQYTHKDVVDLSERVIWGYGPVLRKLLKTADSRLVRKMKAANYQGPLTKRDKFYYRYGQTVIRKKNLKGDGRESAHTPAPTNSSRDTPASQHSQTRLGRRNRDSSQMADEDTEMETPKRRKAKASRPTRVELIDVEDDVEEERDYRNEDEDEGEYEDESDDLDKPVGSFDSHPARNITPRKMPPGFRFRRSRPSSAGEQSPFQSPKGKGRSLRH